MTPTQIWLCDLCHTQQIVSVEGMPSAVGNIATFCESSLDYSLEFLLFKYPDRLIEAFRENTPSIIGFSNYLWNADLSYKFAGLFKQRSPNTVVVMGGPNYDLKLEGQEKFLQRHPFVDFYIVNEAELPFSRLVDNLIKYDFAIEEVKRLGLDNVHTVTEEGHFIANSAFERIDDLSKIPSPYLAGKMDEFFDGKLMPIVETNRGCPFSCTYCVEGNSYYNKITRSTRAKITDEIDYIGAKMKALRALGGRNDLFIADSNFGMYEEDLHTCLEIARAREQYGWPDYVIATTGKNQPKRILQASRILKGKIRMSSSVQSIDPDVLQNIKRVNIDNRQLIEMASDAERISANSFSEVILSLPGDSVAKHLGTLETLIDAGFTVVYVFQLQMLTGSELAEEETRRQYGMKTKYRAISRCFGDYTINSENNLVAAEIEEIATSSSSLTFEDYLRCRKYDLVVSIFYNFGAFQGIVKLLLHLGISRFAWIKKLFEYRFTGALAQLFDDFVRDTKNELWDSKEELETFIEQPETIRKYVDGQLGNNLLFTYQITVEHRHLRDLAQAAGTTVLSLISEAGALTPQIKAFVDDILTYEVLRKLDMFSENHDPLYAKLRHDIPLFLTAKVGKPLSDFVWKEPKAMRFFHNTEQIDIISRSLGAYGRSIVGLTRILARVHVKSLLRHVSAVESDSATRE